MRKLVDRYGRTFVEIEADLFEGHGIRLRKAGRDDAVLATLEAIVTADLDLPAPVPASVSPLQLRRALRQMGMKAAVDAFVATLDEETQEAWEYATQIRRDSPLIAMAAKGLGMTEAAADDLFRLAEGFSG